MRPQPCTRAYSHPPITEPLKVIAILELTMKNHIAPCVTLQHRKIRRKRFFNIVEKRQSFPAMVVFFLCEKATTRIREPRTCMASRAQNSRFFVLWTFRSAMCPPSFWLCS